MVKNEMKFWIFSKLCQVSSQAKWKLTKVVADTAKKEETARGSNLATAWEILFLE